VPALFVELIVYVFDPTAGGVTETFVPVHAVLVVIPGPDTDEVVPVSQFQLNWMLCPSVMGLDVPLIVGTGSFGAAFTVTVVLALLLPPEFVDEIVYVAFPTAVGVTETFVPAQALLVVIPGPETESVVPVPQFQLSWILWPSVMVPDDTEIVGMGACVVVVVLLVPPQAVRITATAESRTCAKTLFFIAVLSL